MTSPALTAATRNLQVDFFRGIALMIIFINHMPSNPLSPYTPSRFGFSDAAETFVFLSGFAAALAYGRCFKRAGIGVGTVRILHRCGQIYSAHLASFFLLATLCVFGNQWLTERDYIAQLNIRYFFDHTQEALVGLFSLRYVPNIFDILPMYLVIMLWLPVVWALSKLHSALALGFPILVYGCMLWFDWELPADPLSDRHWYFNPFAWQFMFFTGFAFGAGWLRVPEQNRGLNAICVAFVLISIPLAHEPIYQHVPFLGLLRVQLEPFLDKNHLGILRWAHFLALALVMNQLFKWKAHWLQAALPRWIAGMGQQSLPVFLLCTCLSITGGMLLDWTGHDISNAALVNLGGLGLMVLAARGLNWLDSKPWKPGAVNARLTESAREHPLPVLDESPLKWARQAVTASILVFMAAAPLVLLQDVRSKGTSSPTVIASLSSTNERFQVEEGSLRASMQDRILLQGGMQAGAFRLFTETSGW